MKPNLLIVQPPHVHLDFVIEQFCERFCESHYVYLTRPHSALREDSPAGVRFLNHSLDRLPGFGCVDTAISVGDVETAARLKESYPEAKLAVWDLGDDGAVPEEILSLLQPVFERPAFGSEEMELAQAI